MLETRGWYISAKVCLESIRKWKNDPRIWSAALLVCLFEWTKIEPIKELCMELEISVSNWYFPFLFTDEINTMFFFFGILILFCDAPFVDRQQMLVVIRSGKKNWFRGKIMYVFVASILYFSWMYLVSLLEFFPYVGFSTEWEMILTELSENGYTYGIQGIHPLPSAVVEALSPMQAWLMAYLVCVLLSVFLGLLIFALNLNQKHNIGVGAALAVILVNGLKNSLIVDAEKKLAYLSPIGWADIEMFLLEENGVPFWYAITFLCVAIILLIVLIMRKSKSYNMEAMEEL